VHKKIWAIDFISFDLLLAPGIAAWVYTPHLFGFTYPLPFYLGLRTPYFCLGLRTHHFIWVYAPFFLQPGLCTLICYWDYAPSFVIGTMHPPLSLGLRTLMFVRTPFNCLSGLYTPYFGRWPVSVWIYMPFMFWTPYTHFCRFGLYAPSNFHPLIHLTFKYPSIDVCAVCTNILPLFAFTHPRFLSWVIQVLACLCMGTMIL
jgi:hypothetical protein